jgi:hypothetical protein
VYAGVFAAWSKQASRSTFDTIREQSRVGPASTGCKQNSNERPAPYTERLIILLLSKNSTNAYMTAPLSYKHIGSRAKK